MTKLALLTGGSRGIGKATAAMLRGRGWDVLAPTRDELDVGSGNPYPYWMPTRREGDKLGAIVFCHGEWISMPVDEQEKNVWMRPYLARVIGSLEIICDNMVSLINAGGCVVMVASTQAFGGRVETGPYAAACAAQVRLIQGLAQSHDGARYNCVCPGLTDTDMAAQVRASGDCKPDAVAQPASAVASAIVGLIESDANGKVLRVVDGVTTEAKWSW